MTRNNAEKNTLKTVIRKFLQGAGGKVRGLSKFLVKSFFLILTFAVLLK